MCVLMDERCFCLNIEIFECISEKSILQLAKSVPAEFDKVCLNVESA